MNSVAQESAEIAHDKARTDPVVALDRAAKARRYEQLIADLENVNTPVFIQQLAAALQSQPLEDDMKLHNAWLKGSDQLVASILRDSLRTHIHVIAAENFE